MESFEGLDNELKKNPLLNWQPMKGPKKTNRVCQVWCNFPVDYTFNN